MKWRAPTRFSLEWWSWLASGAFFFAICTILVLYYQGHLTAQNYLLWALFGSAVGDILLALSFEAIAPTRVIIGPGDRSRDDSDLTETAEIISGFDDHDEGQVLIRGEIWAARRSMEEAKLFHSGDEVKVIGREGLTLLVSGIVSDT